MRRPTVDRRLKFSFVTVLLLFAVGGSLSTSEALSGSGDFPGFLDDVEGLPHAELDPAAIAVLGRGPISTFGISPASYQNARALGDTEAGPVYVVPGTDNGVCLILGDGIACGHVSEAEPLAIFAPGPGGSLVGGGLIPSGVKSVSIAQRGAVTLVAPTRVAGGFLLSEERAVPARGFGGLVVDRDGESE